MEKSKFFGIFLLCCLLVIGNIFLGSVKIPSLAILEILFTDTAHLSSWETIIWEFRLPKLFTAILVGGSLAVSGLQMQTLFRNPLASPDLLGISSGAALGVAVVILAQKYLIGILPLQAVMVAASIGAVSTLLLMLFVAHWTQSSHQLLIIGFMLTTLIGACINLLQYFSQAQELQQYMLWTYGSLSNVTWEKLPLLVLSSIIGISIAIWQAKALNALLLGQDYAQTMGIDVKKVRWAVLSSVGLMVGTVTALCGFIGFVAVAVPQLAALWLRSPNHHVLLPMTALMGASFLLFCDILCYLPTTAYSLPINVVTSIFGSPFIVWLLLRKKY